MANEGVNKLGRVLDGRMKEHDDKPPVLDFGEIQTDRSLITNNFPQAIPFGDYVSCIRISETVSRPIRVLVGWVGDDATVISTIWIGLPAGEAGGN
jgi:methyl coenzyme M reductase alpha subunit